MSHSCAVQCERIAVDCRITLNAAEKPLPRFSTAQGQQIYISKVGIKCAINLHPVFVLKQLVRYNHLIGVV